MSACQLPVRKVRGKRAMGFQPGLSEAPYRMPEEGATAEEASERGTPPWWPDPDCWLPFSASCVEAIILCGGLALPLVLFPRVTTAAAIFLVCFFLSAMICLFYGDGSFVLAEAGTHHRRH